MFAIRQAVPHIGLSDYRTYYENYLLLESGKSEDAVKDFNPFQKTVDAINIVLRVLNLKQKTMISLFNMRA